MSDSPEALDNAFLQTLRKSATERLIEFLVDPKMDGVCTRLRQAGYGFDAEMACRTAVLEQIGTLGEPGLRLGLLVTSLEVLLALVHWDQVARAIRLDQGERSPYLANAIENTRLPRYDLP